MQFQIFAFAFLATVLTVQATPITEARAAAACNADYSSSSCGSCHYWRECLDSRTGDWVEPCPRCDSTSWCNCTAPAGQYGS